MIDHVRARVRYLYPTRPLPVATELSKDLPVKATYATVGYILVREFSLIVQNLSLTCF
jgi:hypothetical protein